MTHPIRIRKAKGLQLAALYDEPPGAGPHPLVILLHGFTGWKEEGHLATLAADLSASGIGAVRFDAPGSGESEGTWAEHYLVSNYLAAVGDVYEHAVQHLSVDRSRVAIWGHSMGGMVAIIAASRSPHRFVAVCGSQPSAGRSPIAPGGSECWTSVETEHFGTIRLPAHHFLERAQLSTADAAAIVEAPLFFIAGEFDEVIPARSVHQTYRAAREPKRYVEFPTGHDYKRDKAALQRINGATVEFFREYLVTEEQR